MTENENEKILEELRAIKLELAEQTKAYKKCLVLSYLFFGALALYGIGYYSAILLAK